MPTTTRTILVIDDEPEQRDSMRTILRLEAYAVLEASDYAGALAVQTKHRGKIDLVVIDISLPGGNGYDLSNALLAIEPHLKVLFISGYAGAELCRFFARPVHFLQKPFRPTELVQRVKSLLEPADPFAGGPSASIAG